MMDFFRGLIRFIVGNIISIMVSTIISFLLTSALAIFGENFGVIYLTLLFIMSFVAFFFIVMCFSKPHIPVLKWNEVILLDVYELILLKDGNIKFHRNSSFKSAKNNDLIIKHGNYDWSDCNVSHIAISSETIETLSEIQCKGISSDGMAHDWETFPINNDDFDESLIPQDNVMEYIFKFPNINGKYVLDYTLDLKPKQDFNNVLYAVIHHPVKELQLKIVSERSVRRVFYEVQTEWGIEYTIVSPKEVKRSDRNGCFEYTVSIRNPKMMCRYSLRWES